MTAPMPLMVPDEAGLAASPAIADPTARRLWLAVGGAWAAISGLLLIICWDHVARLTMWDPDDYMRLAEVRDWIGGQSFFDVTQYRFDPPHGYAMHWSRIVDLPIAALTLLLGERVAVTLVPLLTLGGIMGCVALATARLAGRRAALISALIAATTPLILFYTLPLRIDHHGWQVMMAVLTLAACFDASPRRGGMIAGAGAATWLAVSMEGLPLVSAIAVMQGLRFAIDGRRFGSDARARGFLIALGLTTGFWLMALRGPAGFAHSHGDMLSAAWLGPLALAPLAAALAMPFVADRGIVARLVLLTGATVIGVASLLLIDPTVLSGPFAALDPLVRRYWYDNVSEGLPIWKQPGDTMMMLAAFPLAGLTGTWLAWRAERDATRRRNWIALLFVASAAFAISLFVQRAGAVSHAYMLPGIAVLLTTMLAQIARWHRPLPRVLATVGAVLLCSPLMTASAGMAVLALFQPPEPAPVASRESCAAPCEPFGALNRLPPSYILASLDVGPKMLINTPHRFLGSGYHRNVGAIHGVIAAFTEPPEAAHRTMTAIGATHLLIDPTGNEATIYSQHAPRGLMAALLKGKVPTWLEPVPLPHSPYRLWRRIEPGHS